jgi:hypothetical protein
MAALVKTTDEPQSAQDKFETRGVVETMHQLPAAEPGGSRAKVKEVDQAGPDFVL